MINSKTQIFACTPADDEAIQAAREFIHKNNLTSEDVRMGRSGNTLIVESIREIKLLF